MKAARVAAFLKVPRWRGCSLRFKCELCARMVDWSSRQHAKFVGDSSVARLRQDEAYEVSQREVFKAFGIKVTEQWDVEVDRVDLAVKYGGERRQLPAREESKSKRRKLRRRSRTKLRRLRR